jgi:hypothetical protein
MFAMISEFDRLNRIAIPQEDRTYLYNEKAIPNYWRIWLGYYPASAPYLKKHTFLIGPEERKQRNDARPANTQTTTFSVGDILVHAVSSSFPAAQLAIKQWRFPVQIGSKLVRLWPIRVAGDLNSNTAWPPRSSLNDIEAAFISSCFFVSMGGPDPPPGLLI